MKNIKDYTICAGRWQGDKDREIDGCEGCPLKDKNKVCVFEGNLYLDSWNVDFSWNVDLTGAVK